MNCFYVGIHKTGKSTKAVNTILQTRPPNIWLVAANPNQRDERTGALTFPEVFRRTDVSILFPERKADRQNSAILIDDPVAIRREWKKIEQILATPRQDATDLHLTGHDYTLFPDQLAGYCNIAYCFRTANNVPPYRSWGMKPQMKEAANIIRTHKKSTMHSYFVVNILNGTVKVVL